MFMAADKRRIALRGVMPAFILDKCVVRAQIHGHRRAADGTAGNQFRRNFTFRLFIKHPSNRRVVGVRFLMAGEGTLPEPVVALCVKKPHLIKARFLKAVIHICRDHKIVRILHQPQKLPIHRLWRVHIAVDPNVAAPVCPVFFR